jgi:hypothetical protein
MADHDVVIEAFYDGVWNDISAEVSEGSVKYTRGLTQIGDIKPADMTLVLEDPTDKWRPGNPLSEVYGLAGRAMPLRLTVDGSVRCYTEADSYQPDRTEGFDAGPPVRGRQWVDLGSSGILARINSWDEPVRSPMYRTISALTNLVGHWPMEEGREATQLSNTVSSGTAGIAQTVEFGDSDAPDGAVSALQLSETTSRISGNFSTSASTTAGWQFAWSSKLVALPSSVTYLQMFSWRTSNGYRWTIDVNQDSYRYRVTDSGGTLLEDSTVLHSPSFGQPNQWVTYRMKATESGGTVTAEFAWYVQGQTTPWGSSGTFSGTLGRMVSWSANANAWMEDALISHVYGVTTGTDDLLSYAARRAFDGYVGETAAARADRLLTDEGIPFVLVGTESDTMPMGRQPFEPLSKILKECISTERGLLYDSTSTVGAVEMRTRVDLMLQTPATFTWPTGIASPFKETYDDQGVANYVTASQRDGGEATAIEASGPMSVQNVPDGIGPRKSNVDVNVEEESTLADIAGWELAQGTLEGPRFPSITFDLDAAPSLAVTVNGLDIGDRLLVTGFREFDIDLIVLAVASAPAQKRLKITFTCIPGDVFSTVGEYDGDDQRIDSASTTLKNAVSSTFGDTFEDGAGSWSGQDCTVAASTAQAHSGSTSLLLTAVGAPSQAYVRDYGRTIAATLGVTYRTAMWVRSPQTLTVFAAMDGVDANFGYIGGGYSAPVVLVANTWTRISTSYTAAVGVTQIICGPTMSSPANGNTLYLDDIVCGDGAAVPDLLTFRTANIDDIWSTAEEPYEVIISGEVMRVEQVGSASLVSGEYDQSVIVSRALNGIFKALPAGDPIHVHQPARWAL